MGKGYRAPATKRGRESEKGSTVEAGLPDKIIKTFRLDQHIL